MQVVLCNGRKTVVVVIAAVAEAVLCDMMWMPQGRHKVSASVDSVPRELLSKDSTADVS